MAEALRENKVRLDRWAGAIDRLLPVVGFLVFLFMPASGFSTTESGAWHDQALYLEGLRSVLEGTPSVALDKDIVGPAYLALASVVHDVLGMSPERSLVVLSKLTFATSVALSMVLLRGLVSRLTGGVPPIVSAAAQLSLVVIVLMSWTWRWADVPWTHFVTLCAAVAVFALRGASPRAGVMTSALIGCLLAILALTRSFEFVALALAWVLTWVLFTVLGFDRRPRLAPRVALVGVGAFALTAVGIHSATGKQDVFFLYGSNLGRLSANVLPEEVADTPTVALGLLPTKVVQLFVDPCFHSLCSLDDYSGAPSNLEGIWRMPLAVQLPTMLLLPACIVALGVLVFLARGNRLAVNRVPGLRLLVEMTVAASGITLGYAANSLAGPGHLKYGYVREFLLPATLIAVVALTLAFVGVFAAASRRSQRSGVRSPAVSAEFGTAAVAVALAVAGLGVVSVAREHGLPRIAGRHLQSVTYEAQCEVERCLVTVDARTVTGTTIVLPQASTLTFGCGSARPRFSIYTSTPSNGVLIPAACLRPRLVSGWPLVMGLPPDSAHLRAVDVANLAYTE